jgi:Flp pilus assembly protein TadD
MPAKERKNPQYNDSLTLSDDPWLDQAADCLRQSMSLCADDPELLIRIADRSIALNDYACAEEALRRSLANCPSDPRLWEKLSAVLDSVGRGCESRQAFEHAARLSRPPAISVEWAMLKAFSSCAISYFS